jgi:hypothetical protein
VGLQFLTSRILTATSKKQITQGRHPVFLIPAAMPLMVRMITLQVVMGEWFGMSQAAANPWIHRLLPRLQEALTAMGVMPERAGRKFAQGERRQSEPTRDSIDGTERRRHRPKNPEKQALHYRGKKKIHRDKNVVSVNTRSKRVGDLSPTDAGKTHDKKAENLISYNV